jgi:hypothetical protein
LDVSEGVGDADFVDSRVALSGRRRFSKRRSKNGPPAAQAAGEFSDRFRTQKHQKTRTIRRRTWKVIIGSAGSSSRRLQVVDYRASIFFIRSE